MGEGKEPLGREGARGASWSGGERNLVLVRLLQSRRPCEIIWRANGLDVETTVQCDRQCVECVLLRRCIVFMFLQVVGLSATCFCIFCILQFWMRLFFYISAFPTFLNDFYFLQNNFIFCMF